VPALRALRDAAPEGHVVLACPAPLAPLVRLADVADEVVDTAGPVPPRWSGPPPDLAVDLHGRGPQSHRALLSLAPGRLVGFDCPRVGHRGPRWQPEEHERARWCRLLTEALGLRADPDDVRIRTPRRRSPSPGAVVVHPGAASFSRRWFPDRFAAVARDLGDDGHPVVVTGGPDEVPTAREVAEDAGLGPGAVLAGQTTDLEELAALVAGARLVVCGDTGVAHLASAYGVPSVVLFGPVPPSQWGPPVAGPHTVLWHESPPGDPHGDTVDPALAEITVDEVLAAARTRLALPPGKGQPQAATSGTV
jgi:hypothetical protein